LQANISPKVVHFKLGNISLQDLVIYFDNHWHQIIRLLDKHFFVVAEKTGLEVIG